MNARFDARALREDGPSLDPEFVARVMGKPPITVQQANDLAAKQLLAAERSYWLAFYARADTEEDIAKACAELDALDKHEATR